MRTLKRIAADAMACAAAGLGRLVRRCRIVVAPQDSLTQHDEFSAAFEQIEQEFHAVLRRLDIQSETGVALQFDCMANLRVKLEEHAARLRELSVSSADMHRRARSNLLDMLAWIRELISMIHLAQLARAPASRTQELLAQIAAAAESVAVAVEDRSDSPRKS